MLSSHQVRKKGSQIGMNELLRNFLCENNSEPFSISKMLAGLMRGSLKGQWEISTISIKHAIFLDKIFAPPSGYWSWLELNIWLRHSNGELQNANWRQKFISKISTNGCSKFDRGFDCQKNKFNPALFTNDNGHITLSWNFMIADWLRTKYKWSKPRFVVQIYSDFFKVILDINYII